MTREEAERLVETMFAAFNARDLATIESLVDPELEFFSLVAASEGRSYHGRAGMGEFFADMEAAFDELSWEEVGVELIGEDRLLIGYVLAGVGRGSGIPLRERLFAVGWIRDGRVLRAEIFSGREEALAALAQRSGSNRPTR